MQVQKRTHILTLWIQLTLRKQRTTIRSYSTAKFNVIGFHTENIKEYKICPLDPGVRLIMIKGKLKCPTCGYSYQKEEAPNEEGIAIKHKQQKPMILSGGKKKRKFYDEQGTELPQDDPDVMKDLSRGYRYLYYKEDKI